MKKLKNTNAVNTHFIVRSLKYHAMLRCPPRADEREAVREYFAEVGRKVLIEELVWALVHSKEFSFGQ